MGRTLAAPRPGVTWTGRFAGAVAFLCLVGCGGAARQTKQQAAVEEEPAFDPAEKSDGSEEVIVGQEIFDEIEKVFRMKRPVVARCFSDAVEHEQIPKTSKGRITLTVGLDANGHPRNVQTAEFTVRGAKTVQDCVVKAVRSWQFPAPGALLDVSFSYDFEPE